MPRALLLGLLFLVVTPTGSATAQNDTASVPGSIEVLSDSIRTILEEEHLPGAAVALVRSDGSIWSRGFGLANRTTERPMTDSTPVRIGSISKMFVGVAALQLQERGALDLQDPLQKLIPDLELTNPWSEEHPVRLVHLLEHTAGLDGYHPPMINAPREGLSLRERITYHPHWLSLRWPPGRFYAYSSPGTTVAAYALQQAMERSFEGYVEAEIFDPLDMSSATYRQEEALERGLAAGYESPESDTAVPYRRVMMRPSGAASASVRDLARFVQMLVQDGTLDGRRVLGRTSVERMERPTTTLSVERYGIPTGYGITSVTDDRNGFLWHGHTGGTPGYVSAARYLDAHDRGYVALFNVRSERHEKIVHLLEDYLTRDVTTSSPEPAPVTPDELAQYEGYYVDVAPRNELQRIVTTLTSGYQVTAGKRGLEVAPLLGGGAFHLNPAGDGRFFTSNDPTATHAFVTAEGATHLQFNGGEDGTLERTSAVLVWARWGIFLGALALMVSSLLFALIWGPRALLGRIRSDEPLQVRAWPLLASLSFFTFATGIATIMSNPSNTELIAEPNVYALAVTTGSVLLAAFAGIGLVQSFRLSDSANRWAWWHSTLVSSACLVMTNWLGYYGLLGLRLWAY